MERAWHWVKRHRGIVAAIAAIWVVLKLGRWVAGGAWAARQWIPWDDTWSWLGDHWPIAVLAAAALFAVTFVAVRALIGALDRRKARRAPDNEAPAPAPSSPDLVPGDPLAARRDG